MFSSNQVWTDNLVKSMCHSGSSFSKILYIFPWDRFVNTDYALVHSIRQCQNQGMTSLDTDFLISCDHLVSCNISCAYWVNVVDCFHQHLPDLVSYIERIHWLIPLVHLQNQNHKDNCMYGFASAYILNAGYFHSETAEHYWAESNQLRAQTWQINNGHCQDTLIDHLFEGSVQSSFLPPKHTTMDSNQSRTNPNIEWTKPNHLGPVFCGPCHWFRPIKTGFFA